MGTAPYMPSLVMLSFQLQTCTQATVTTTLLATTPTQAPVGQVIVFRHVAKALLLQKQINKPQHPK